MTSLLVFILTILVLVSVHEFGHFGVARLMGIKVLRYSIGFGKPILSWLGKSGTEYAIAWLPLGGYVKLLDGREGEVSPNEVHLAFDNKPIWQRTLVVLAGPAINFLFAILAFWFVFTLGIEQVKPIIGEITPNSIAAKSNLKPNQEILSINGKKTDNWQSIAFALIRRLGEKGNLTLTAKPFPQGVEKTYQLNLAHWKVNELEPQLIESLGIMPFHPFMPVVLGKIEKKGAAAKAGLKVNDEIIAVDGQPVKDWKNFVQYISTKPNQPILIQVKRDNQPLEYPIQLGSRFVFRLFKKVGYLGVRVKPVPWPDNMRHEEKYSWWHAILPATKQTWEFLKLNTLVLTKIIKGDVSLKALGGPITIYRTAGQAFKQGLVIFISFLGLMSVMLGFVNILPVPGLDGGHLLYFLIEKIKKRPISAPAQVLMVRLGMIALVVLIFQVTINDILRLFL